MQPNKSNFDIIAFGESAVLVNFEQKIQLSTHQQIIQLQKAIQALPGVQFNIPAYCSLTIGFDTDIWTLENFQQSVHQLALQLEQNNKQEASRLLEIPVCYAPDFALDLELIAQNCQLSTTEVVTLHHSSTYHVYMLGFLPGFPYMGSLNTALHCPRKQSPRLRIPAGSVGIASSQTGIYPTVSPGGWQIIGQTPLNLFTPQKAERFLFQAGDQVRFYPITAQSFEHIKKDIANNSFKIDQRYA